MNANNFENFVFVAGIFYWMEIVHKFVLQKDKLTFRIIIELCILLVYFLFCLVFRSSYIKFTQPFRSVRRDFDCCRNGSDAVFHCLVSTFNENVANIMGLEIFVIVSFKMCFVCTFFKTVKIHFICHSCVHFNKGES